MHDLPIYWAELTQRLLTPQAAWLPAEGMVPLALWINWALVLGAVMVWLGRSLPERLRWMSVGLVMTWTLVCPVLWLTYSPAYWLGLAFQSPSLTSALLCLMYLITNWRRRYESLPWRQTSFEGVVPMVAIAGMVMGWVLLLDMLAWWPVSLYALGFDPLALALMCVLIAGLWLVWGDNAKGKVIVGVLASVVMLFVVTRLPSGNLWDALLDPWLWVSLQVWTVRRLGRWWFGSQP